jgi:hypothetical protein
MPQRPSPEFNDGCSLLSLTCILSSTLATPSRVPGPVVDCRRCCLWISRSSHDPSQPHRPSLDGGCTLTCTLTTAEISCGCGALQSIKHKQCLLKWRRRLWQTIPTSAGLSQMEDLPVKRSSDHGELNGAALLCSHFVVCSTKSKDCTLPIVDGILVW